MVLWKKSAVLDLVDRGYVDGGLERIQLARPETFETFYRRRLPELLVLGRVLAGPELGGVVAQETMLVGSRRWDDVGREPSPVARIRAMCLDEADVLARRHRIEQAFLRWCGSFRAYASPARGTDAVWGAVRALPPSQRRAVAITVALDLPVDEAAEVLGRPPVVVAGDLDLAARRLVGRLAPSAGAEGGAATGVAGVRERLREIAAATREEASTLVAVDDGLEALEVATRRRRVVRAVVSVIGVFLAGAVVLPVATVQPSHHPSPVQRTSYERPYPPYSHGAAPQGSASLWRAGETRWCPDSAPGHIVRILVRRARPRPCATPP